MKKGCFGDWSFVHMEQCKIYLSEHQTIDFWCPIPNAQSNLYWISYIQLFQETLSEEKQKAFKGTGSRLSECLLIKLLLSNLLFILSVNNPTHMYLSDLRVYFKVELYSE